MNSTILNKYGITIKKLSEGYINIHANDYYLTMFLRFNTAKVVVDGIINDLNLAINNQHSLINEPDGYYADYGADEFFVGEIKSDGTFFLHHDYQENGTSYPITDIKEIFLSIQELL